MYSSLHKVIQEHNSFLDERHNIIWARLIQTFRHCRMVFDWPSNADKLFWRACATPTIPMQFKIVSLQNVNSSGKNIFWMLSLHIAHEAIWFWMRCHFFISVVSRFVIKCSWRKKVKKDSCYSQGILESSTFKQINYSDPNIFVGPMTSFRARGCVWGPNV